ncbi:MAG: glycosyltransferase [Candidatus Aminicenantes bacterium]|nr:glycosyltransferase [Candidatus Aminicenantes bacterium]
MKRAAKRPCAVAMIPTYNEAENIAPLIRDILALDTPCDLHILVADDDSPDGTWRIVRRMAARDRRVHLLRRLKRRGRGAGGIDGFRAALDLGADYVVEMDGDFSHRPAHIPALLDAAGRADLVIGSRFVKGGRDADRSLWRRAVTWGVRRFIRRLFRVPVRDVSSGFRVFSRRLLEALDLEDLISVGPSVVLETLFKTHLMGFRTIEVPIVFVDRVRGRTKLDFVTLLETLAMALKFKKRYAPLEARRAAAASPSRPKSGRRRN